MLTSDETRAQAYKFVFVYLVHHNSTKPHNAFTNLYSNLSLSPSIGSKIENIEFLLWWTKNIIDEADNGDVYINYRKTSNIDSRIPLCLLFE